MTLKDPKDINEVVSHVKQHNLDDDDGRPDFSARALVATVLLLLVVVVVVVAVVAGPTAHIAFVVVLLITLPMCARLLRPLLVASDTA
jgi:Flp pilus assembly protein TadB